jgi:hypothetical protein
MRRGAAWPLAERPSSCLTARSAVSRTDRRPHRRACMGRRAPQAPSAGTRFGVPAGTRSAWWPRISGAGPALSACPVLSSIRCPVSCVLCPVSGVRCPVSTRAMSTRPASSVRVSAVRCGRPVSGVQLGVRHLGIRRPLSGRSTSAVSDPGEFVKRADAASSHTARTAGVGVVAPRGIHDRLVVCPSRSLTLEAGAGRAGPTEASAWPWSSGVLGQRPGSTAWPTRRGRLRRDRSSVGSRVRGEVRPPAAWLGAGRQGHDRRHEADHDLGAGWPAPGGPWARLRGGRAAPTRPRQAVGATGLGAAAL